ncbi:MAG: 2-hydroxyacyl-CoA dehydratase family protein [Actinobacteria bacterium]|nr:2-hydroxyacyl-CoA dehydratase family protein [Actinomycetota bacterium]
MTATCYHSCALIRPGFLARRGFAPRSLAALALAGDGRRHPDGIETHPNTCPWVVQLLTAAESTLTAPGCTDLIVAPAGCDAMRRMGDMLAVRLGDRIYRPWVPRTADEAAIRRLAKELEALDAWLERHATGRTAAPPAAANPAGKADPATTNPATARPDTVVSPPVEPRPGGVFVIAGPLSGVDLLRAIEDAGVPVSGLDSCTGVDRAAALAAGDARLTFDAEAREMLAAAVCPRSAVTLRREHLASRIADAHPAGLIHARLPFCDPGAYDGVLARSLADELELPFLDIEVGYPSEVTGPVRVRLEAFLERLTLDDDLLDDLVAFDDPLPQDLTRSPLPTDADRPNEVRSGRS